MDGFLTQARSWLSYSIKAQRDREWLDKVRVVNTSQPLLQPTVDPEVFEQVSNALYANQWLVVEYQNAAGKRTALKVMPLGLAQQGSCMYLVCRFDGYPNERCLTLHLIISASASAMTYDHPNDFDLKKFVKMDDLASEMGRGFG